MQIKFKLLNKQVKAPVKAHDTDAGFDLFLPKRYDVSVNNRIKIPMGLAIEIPKGYFGDLRLRSSVGVDTGLVVKGGVIDSGYIGEVFLVLQNCASEAFILKAGEAVAQLLILPVPKVELLEVSELENTPRGTGGFGSTNKE